MIKNIIKTDTSTKMDVLLAPFGSPSHKDLHGEFFDKNTDFGLDMGVTKVYAMYDHSTKNNPAAVERELIGTATYTKTDDAGLWFEFELQKAHEYHDYILKLGELGVLGASSGTFHGAKTMDPHIKGRIARWVIGEGSLTVTPAEPTTVGKAVSKSVPEIVELVNNAIQTYNMKLPLLKSAGDQIELAQVVDETTPVEPVTPAEPVVTNAEVPADLDAAVKEILGEVPPIEPAPVVETVVPEEVVKRLEGIENTLKMMSAMFDMWGSPEEIKEAFGALSDLLGKVNTVSSEVGNMKSGILTLATFMKTMKVGSVVAQLEKASEAELQVQKQFANSEAKQPISNSKIPANAPGGRKS